MANVRDALWASGQDESVEVNQRALIDKVLARYSGEFTVFRELLQNSDDASAKAAEIHFETQPHLSQDKTAPQDDTLLLKDSSDKLPDLKTSVVHQWTFKNDGMPFRDQDWTRLKKIAEGNPDEEKIGAFGVGFYSLFSVTEEPFVTSGGQWMGFHWKDKKDQLFARRGSIPSTESAGPDPWTTFTMPLREPGPPPPPFDFIRFLTSSITFMAHLTEVSVFFDGKRLARIRKERGVPRLLGLRKGLKAETPKRLMRVTRVTVTPLSIKAEVMQWVYSYGSPRKRHLPAVIQDTRKAVSSGFFSTLFSTFGGTPQRQPSPMPEAQVQQLKEQNDEAENGKLHGVIESSVVLAVFSAAVDVVLDERMKREILRATKKSAPQKMEYQLIYTGKDEYDASKKEDEHAAGSIFQGLRADIEGNGTGRIFIGHSTGQTTGIGGHMAARFIPTVERESVDLVDRNIRIWNEELLGVGGYLARTAYEQEMDDISTLWSTSQDNLEIKTHLRSRALHALQFFTFHASTPAPQVATVLEEAFFSCVPEATMFSALIGAEQSSSFPIISTTGIRSASAVRLPNAIFAEFLKQLPVLPEDVIAGASAMVGSLRGRGMIKEITFEDVLQELRARPLSESELVACFKWWVSVHQAGKNTQVLRVRSELLNAALLSLGTAGEKDEKIVLMSSIQTFLNMRSIGSSIPTDGPLPDSLLPLNISRNFDPQSLISAFGWKELTIGEWLRHVLDPDVSKSNAEYDLTLSPTWAERVLNVLARVWPACPRVVQEDVINLLKDKICIPTSAGLRTPQEAYFQNAHVFPDLPLITLPSGAPVKGPLEKFVEALGVRKHVELQIVFDRMLKAGDWSIVDLIKYLVAVQSTLSSEELDRLRLTPAFPKENGNADATSDKTRKTRSRAEHLYEPLDVFKELGLPVIDWGSKKWRGSSEEAKFLFLLGLRRFPPLDTVLGLAAGPDERIRGLALKYFLDNFAARYSDYQPASYSQLAFIPALKGRAPCMAKPGEVFASSTWARLGFMILNPNLQADAATKLGVKDHPPASFLVSLLEKSPPETEDVARLWFGAMATRTTDFAPRDLRSLSRLLIVPVTTLKDGEAKAGSAVRLIAPSQCYFKRDTNGQIHSKLFTFVDFGPQANQFLSACGTKHEPTVEEIAVILLEDPSRFWELADGRDNFLIELRNIAVNRRLLSPATLTRMKQGPIFLGSRRIKREKFKSKESSADLEEDENWEYEYGLFTPDKIVIADDTNAYRVFGDSIFACPQEDLLEDFYSEVGSRRLSSIVEEEYRTTTEIKGSRKAVEIRSLILERLPLFLHEHTHAKPRVPFSWLNNNTNFVVRTFGKLTVTKSLTYGEVRAVRNQDSSAVAMRVGRGPIELWLAGNDLVDMFEVSTSICRLLFDSPRASDALLFMTILSTDLRALRRRGYNVDRILQKQKTAAEDAAKERAQQTALVPQDVLLAMAHASAAIDQRPGSPSSESALDNDVGLGREKMQPPHWMPKGNLKDNLDSWKRILTSKNGSRPVSVPVLGAGSAAEPPSDHQSISSAPIPESANGSPSPLPPAPTTPAPILSSSSPPHTKTQAPLLSPSRPTASRPVTPAPLLSPPRPTASRPVTPGPTVTPRDHIAANIDMAIRACRQEEDDLLRNKQNMRIIKESLNNGYCDVSGHGGDMMIAGDMGGIKFYVSRDIPHAQQLLTVKRDSLARFIHIIKPLGEVYGLPATSLHVFYDISGGLIAFNRKASLFLNLRFFEAWHDVEVRNGELSQAFISWYFTLAHEIAHNLVLQHNSEHEFYFQSICEAHLLPLSRLIASSA